MVIGVKILEALPKLFKDSPRIHLRIERFARMRRVFPHLTYTVPKPRQSGVPEVSSVSAKSVSFIMFASPMANEADSGFLELGHYR
jgi:hypothetical protein